MLHLVSLVAALSVGFCTAFVYSATWLGQVAHVPARTAFSVNTMAMGLSFGVTLLAGWVSDRIGRRRVLSVTAGALLLLAYPLMALMTRGDLPGILTGELGLAILVAANGGVIAATMAELAPWRVRSTVLSIAYNVTLALFGGTTPLIATWLISRTGVPLAPAIYLAGAAALTFVGALLLPKIVRHSVTNEVQVAPA